MIYFLNTDGSMTRQDTDHVYQGSNVNVISVISSKSGSHKIAFTLPTGTTTLYQPMVLGASNNMGDGIYLYTYNYTLPSDITQTNGTVGVSIQVYNTRTVSGTTYYDIETSYTASFSVEYSALPTTYTTPTTQTETTRFLDLMDSYYTQNATTIATLTQRTYSASSGEHIGEVGTPSVTATLNSTTNNLDFAFNYLKGATGAKGDTGDTGNTGLTAVECSYQPELTSHGTQELGFSESYFNRTPVVGDNYIIYYTQNGALYYAQATVTSRSGSTGSMTITSSLQAGTQVTYANNLYYKTVVSSADIPTSYTIGTTVRHDYSSSFNRTPVANDVFLINWSCTTNSKSYLTLWEVSSSSGGNIQSTYKGCTETTGAKGDTGSPAVITATYTSIALMQADTSKAVGTMAVINTGSVEDTDTGKVYYWDGTTWNYLTDLSGARGVQGQIALECSYMFDTITTPTIGYTIVIESTYFNRTANIGDLFLFMFGTYICSAEVTYITTSAAGVTTYTGTVKAFTSLKGATGEKGDKGNTGNDNVGTWVMAQSGTTTYAVNNTISIDADDVATAEVKVGNITWIHYTNTATNKTYVFLGAITAFTSSVVTFTIYNIMETGNLITANPASTTGTLTAIGINGTNYAVGGGTTYTAGDGIDITNDEISIDPTDIPSGSATSGQSLVADGSGGASWSNVLAGAELDSSNNLTFKSASASGVDSIGGATGAITLGTGLSISNNELSASGGGTTLNQYTYTYSNTSGQTRLENILNNSKGNVYMTSSGYEVVYAASTFTYTYSTSGSIVIASLYNKTGTTWNNTIATITSSGVSIATNSVSRTVIITYYNDTEITA